MTRITAEPGGASTISFGNYKAPAPAAAPAPLQVTVDATGGAQPEAAVTTTPAAAVDFESLRVQAISAISSCRASDQVAGIISNFLTALSAVGAQPRAILVADDSLEKLKAILKSRGTHGILSIGKRFQIMDDSGDKKIGFDEFSKAMKELNLEETDTHKLFRYFDADCSGCLSYDELLVGLRGQLEPRRLDMVQRAFKVLDKTGDGQVTMADLKDRYNAKSHPDVMLGTKTEDEVLGEFMGSFEAQGGGSTGDGVITFDEFKKYYEAVSASIDTDDYFELVIRNAWHISGGEGWCANTTCKRLLVLHEDGSQTVHEIQDDFDVPKEQYLQKLKDQGVTGIKSIASYGGPDDVPEGKGTPATAAPPASLSSPTSAGASASVNKRHQLASSITFG